MMFYSYSITVDPISKKNENKNKNKSTVNALVLGPCWTNVSTPTKTCCLQTAPTIGPTI